MKNWTEEELIAKGYMIRNAKIEDADLDMSDHGCVVLRMPIEGNGFGCVLGGECLGHGYLGAKEFSSYEKSLEYIMRIMNVVGVERFNDLQDKYIRVATQGWGGYVKIIGNLIHDEWFDMESFFDKGKQFDEELERLGVNG